MCYLKSILNNWWKASLCLPIVFESRKDLQTDLSSLVSLICRQRFPLMAFCSYSIFLKIAASFSMVTLVVFEKGPHWSWAYLWGTFSLLWGLFSLPVRIGCLFLNLLPTHPRKVPGIHEVFCFPEFPLRWKVHFYPPLLDASLLLLKKKGTVHLKIAYTPDKDQIQQNPK